MSESETIEQYAARLATATRRVVDDIDAALAENDAAQRAYDRSQSACRPAEHVDTRWHPDRCRCVACRDKTSRDAAGTAGEAPPFAWATGAHVRRPRLLDLFCCAGGAGMGYRRAGFDVTGVDIESQPLHWAPQGDVIQFDALAVLAEHPKFVAEFDAIHASPPCQASTALTKGTNRATRSHLHVDLIGRVRELLDATGLPYIIENVQGAKLRADVKLCGEMFGLGVIRHRVFELGGGWTMPQPEHRPHRGRVRGWRHGAFFDGPYVAVYGEGGGKGAVDEWREAMGIDWLCSRAHLAEAIPPAYTEHIGRALIEHLGAAEARAA